MFEGVFGLGADRPDVQQQGLQPGPAQVRLHGGGEIVTTLLEQAQQASELLSTPVERASTPTGERFS